VAPAVLRKRRAGRGTHKDTPFAHVAGKSDHCVVPEKAPNKRRKVCGGAGGKAMDQGEPHGGTHGPDADRDTRVPVSPWGAGSRVSAASRQVSEIRAVCVSSACTDLCGGCRVTGIPTATQRRRERRRGSPEGRSTDHRSPEAGLGGPERTRASAPARPGVLQRRLSGSDRASLAECFRWGFRFHQCARIGPGWSHRR
jgi:hypothetical protein